MTPGPGVKVAGTWSELRDDRSGTLATVLRAHQAPAKPPGLGSANSPGMRRGLATKQRRVQRDATVAVALSEPGDPYGSAEGA
jgi:hypothetical protein